jgi:twitching motility protein PilT
MQECSLNQLLLKMLEFQASDLFITSGKKTSIRKNTKIETLPYSPFSSEEIDKFRKSVLLPEAEKTFLATGSYDAGITYDNNLRFRINFFRQQGVPGLVARLVPSGALSLKDLYLPQMIAEFAEVSSGLVLVVGPAGSGKSTTMAAMLNHINSNNAKHIITIEDPIEFIHQDLKSIVTQREVGADTVTFADALKHVVRESPDVIFIGEMRDFETMQTAVGAALTGHLVVTTLHASNVAQSIERIINHYPEHLREQAALDLSLALQGVVAQRLVPSKENNTMIPAVELLRATPIVKHTIATRKFSDLEEIMKRSSDDGMLTFSRALANLCIEGLIDIKDGAAISANKDEFLLLVQGMESGIETFRSIDNATQSANKINMKRLLKSAIANNASDLIITSNARPTLRINGDLTPLDIEEMTPVITKNLLFSVLNARQREIFEETREIDFALSVKIKRKDSNIDNDFRFRVNGFYQRGNIGIAVRVIPKRIPTPEELFLPHPLLNLAKKKQGLILVTGPTGHGKSTTLASLINLINETRSCHIITVEDPIEYVHMNKSAVVEQREVYADTLSFSSALKYVLRQDPDVILVGEMRDPETISAALTAAETGHLVMATLHTNDAAQSIDRIIDSFPSHQQNQIRIQLAGSLLGIISQRLLQRRDGKGRIAAFEMLINSSAVKNIIREGKTHLAHSVMETGSKDGMITMDKALFELYQRNIISRQEAMGLVNSTDNFNR